MRKKRQSFDSLSDAEKEAIHQRMERIGVTDGEALTTRDRAEHRRARLTVGRPRVGRGAKRINISMERGLLDSADEFAKQKGMTRARLIAESVRAFLRRAA